MLRKLLIGLVLAIVSLGITRVRLEVDVLDLLPQEMPEVQGLRLFLQHFSKNEELILTLEHEDPEHLETDAHLGQRPLLGIDAHAGELGFLFHRVEHAEGLAGGEADLPLDRVGRGRRGRCRIACAGKCGRRDSDRDQK